MIELEVNRGTLETAFRAALLSVGEGNIALATPLEESALPHDVGQRIKIAQALVNGLGTELFPTVDFGVDRLRAQQASKFSELIASLTADDGNSLVEDGGQFDAVTFRYSA